MEYVFVLIQTKRTPYGVTIVLIGPPLTSQGKKGLLPWLFNFWRGLFWDWCKVYVLEADFWVGAVAMGLSKDKKGESKNGVWWDGRRVVGGA